MLQKITVDRKFTEQTIQKVSDDFFLQGTKNDCKICVCNNKHTPYIYDYFDKLQK